MNFNKIHKTKNPTQTNQTNIVSRKEIVIKMEETQTVVILIVDRKDKAQMAWKQKEKTVSETSCSVSETEKKEELVEFGMGFELLKAETSFTKMGSEEPNQKPIQGEVKPTATKHQTENKERDKRSGPATYGGKQPIALQNRFQLLGSNEEVKT